MTNEEAKAFLDNLKVCIKEHPIVADWLVEIADRKTEPTCSKMEQVEDEPQSHTVDLGNGFSITANDCDTCKHRDKPFDDLPCDMCCKAHSGYEPKDEPHTDCPFKDVPCSCGEQTDCSWK